jgi:hypothetical protein
MDILSRGDILQKIHLARFHIKLYPKESLKKVIRQSDINDRVLEKQLII